MADLELFDEALASLQDSLPSWWAREDPDSELVTVLTVLANQVDLLSAAFEGLAINASVTTADATGLVNGLGYALGIREEDFPFGSTEVLRAYILARAAEDGSVRSLETTLLSLLVTDVNLYGAELVFPGGGGGLTFPADGSGLLLYQATASTRVGLTFAPDGSGLTFPDQALYFDDGGDGIALDAEFPDVDPLTFPSVGYLEISQDFVNRFFTVTTKSYLAFDRPAFRRAIERFRLAHLLPAVYVEIAP